MLDIAVVDDDDFFVKSILEYLEQFQKDEGIKFRIKVFYSGVDFMTNYKPDYDIVLMDIDMPGFNGLETARELRLVDENICLIFITNLAQYAVRGYEVEALDFVVKPISYFNFCMKLKRAIKYSQKKDKEKLIISLKYENISVNVKDIGYIESDKHYLFYHIGDKIYKERGTMTEIEEKLLPYGFLRCNKCYLVNMKQVVSFSGDSVFVGTAELQISRPRKKQFLDALTTFLE